MKMKNEAFRRIGAVLSAVIICISCTATTLYASEKKLIPGGMAFGVRLFCEGVLVVGVDEVSLAGNVSSPAKDAGIMANDVILSVNGAAVTGAEEISRLINEGKGEALLISVRRGERELTFTVTPVMTDDGSYKTGLIIRDGAAGIGTVTYIDGETGRFAGLGHGICEPDSEKLAPMTRGVVLGAEISGVIKGERGTPGELQGGFSAGKIGTVTGNTECGVYGIFCEMPEGICCEPVSVAEASEICDGEAYVLCTTGDDGVGRYRVNISDIDRSGRETKNFVVTVTDPELLSRTGGIVQGMSGSPIIQSGKLIGAITHVLVNDPTRGYGIFIENMLEAAS